MTKPIKLTKDRQGESFYPATTTDAVVHPEQRKTLTEIIDSLSSGIEDGSVTMEKLADDVKASINRVITKNDLDQELINELNGANQTAVSAGTVANKAQNDVDDLKTKAVISTTITNIEEITQTAYDSKLALGELSNTTIYLITD